METTDKHLWEVDHAYYCNLGNYFSNDCGQHYESFDAFLEDWGSADPDYNLLFRWDWRFDEETGHHLEIFWIGQRKGLFMYSYVDVTPDDEQRVIEFLKPKKQHLIGLWEGIND